MYVDRRSKLSYDEFEREYLFANRPVVLEDASEQWGALKTWTPDFFRDRFGDRSVSADGKTFTVARYIEILHKSTPDDPAPYMHNIDIAQIFPELLADLEPIPAYFQPNWLHDRYFPSRLDNIMRLNSVVEAYIGGPGGAFPVIHFDSMYTHAFLTQVYGEKEFYLWAPDQAPYMYARRRNNISDVNDAAAPDLDRFPLFAKAQGERLALTAGQTAFIPSGWWHTARMLTESITVSANVVNASNWQDVARDIARGQSGPVRAALAVYMSVLGMVKRTRRAAAC